jgi:hypothetical protein
VLIKESAKRVIKTTKQRKRTLFPSTRRNASLLVYIPAAGSVRIIIIYGGNDPFAVTRARASFMAILNPVIIRTAPEALSRLSIVGPRG